MDRLVKGWTTYQNIENGNNKNLPFLSLKKL